MCSKRLLQRKHPEYGFNVNASTSHSEQFRKQEILFKTVELECGIKTTNPPSCQLPKAPLTATSDVCGGSKEKACVVVDQVPKPSPARNSSPFCPVSVVVDTAQVESCVVIDVPVLSSPDTSFTCSSLSEEFPWPETPQSSSSLTSVSSHEDAPLSRHSILLTTEQESLLPTTLNQTLLESSSSIHPTTPKQSLSFNLAASASEESTARTVSMEMHSSSSSSESCKRPVTPSGEVVLITEDGEDKVVLPAIEKPEATTIGTSVSTLNNEDDNSMTRPLESAANDKACNWAENLVSKKTGVTDESLFGVTVVGLMDDENDGVTQAENGDLDISCVKDVDKSVTGLDENAGIKITIMTSEGVEGEISAEEGDMEFSGEIVDDENWEVAVQNVTIDLFNVRIGENDGATTLKNAVMEISGTGRELKPGVIEFKNAVITLSRNGLMTADEVIIAIRRKIIKGEEELMN